MGYTFLSDQNREIIPAFGIQNPRFPESSAWYGVAQPIIFVVGKDGTIRHRFSLRNYQNRPEVDLIFDILKGEAKG